MKYKYAFLGFLGLLCFLALTSLGYMQNGSAGKLKLAVNSSKTAYKLGEVVSLSFELKNESKEDISIKDIFGVGTGYLSVYISQDSGKTFQKYEHGWGLADIANALTVLKPDESVKSSATILQHYKPNGLAGESREVINTVSKTTIMTDYAFPKEGTYYIKAKYLASVKGKKNAIQTESEPIQITIEEPTAEDLEVWNKIKDNGDIAYFLQEGDFKIPTYKYKEREKLRQVVEQILIDHPNSSYVQPLKQSLEKFQTTEEKTKENLERIKQPQ